MADMHEGELELELESEFHEGELEGEEEAGLEGEGWLSALGNVASSLLGEGEEELETEDEGEGEGWLGAIGNIAGSLLGEGEEESETEGEWESEEETEDFLSFSKVLRQLAKKVAPRIGSVILGPMGGALLGKAANTFLESETEMEDETEEESESEMAHEIAAHALTHYEAEAEMLAEAASHSSLEGEAEAMVGAAVVGVISPRDRRALRRILPHLLRATTILTRILRSRRMTRPALRLVPTIVRRSVRDLKVKGGVVTRRKVAQAVTRQVRRVLGSRKACAAAMRRNARASRTYRTPATRRRGMSSGSSSMRRRRSSVR